MTLRAFSFGGGVQSVACLVLAYRGVIDYPLFLFANVGDNAENPQTLAYFREYAMPFAQKHGIELVELRKLDKHRNPVDLYDFIMSSTNDIPIPSRSMEGAPGMRGCTNRWKVKVISKELAQRGATQEDRAILGMGISIDELHRARNDRPNEICIREYPLIALRMSRTQCAMEIERAGLPIPPKSACGFCPFHNKPTWLEMARNEPERFNKATTIERRIQEIDRNRGRPITFLTNKGINLDVAIKDDGQMDLFTDQCESGFCMV